MIPQDQVNALNAAIAIARNQLNIIESQAAALLSAWPAPVPSSVLDELIKSVNGTPHEALVPGVGPGWDWYAHGVIQSSPGSRKASSAWASFQEQTGNTLGLSIETRNWQHWALANGVWRRLTMSVYGSQVHPTPPHEGGIVGDMGMGPNFAIPRHGQGAQWFSPQCSLPAGASGVITAFEVRLPPGVVANLLVAAGGDYWPVAGSSSGNGGAMVGRFVKPISKWRWVAASGLSEAVLRATPPPL